MGTKQRLIQYSDIFDLTENKFLAFRSVLRVCVLYTTYSTFQHTHS